MDRSIDFLRELAAQQERDPNHDPSGQTVAEALNLDAAQIELLLGDALAEDLVEILPAPKRAGDGPLDNLLKITMMGRIAIERATTADRTSPPDPSMRFLRAVSSHLDANQHTRVSADTIRQGLRLSREDTATALEDLATLGLIKVHNGRARMTGETELLEMTAEGRHALSEARTVLVGSTPGEPLKDTWVPRDLPVLREAARVLDSEAGKYGLRVQDLVDATGLSINQVELALRALEEDALLEVRWVHPREASRVSGLSSEARRKVKLWPTAETALDRMITALEAIAQNTDEDEDTRTRARKILDGLSGAGRTIGISLATTMATGQLPGQ